jgi:hypothetical protein
MQEFLRLKGKMERYFKLIFIQFLEQIRPPTSPLLELPEVFLVSARPYGNPMRRLGELEWSLPGSAGFNKMGQFTKKPEQRGPHRDGNCHRRKAKSVNPTGSSKALLFQA